MTKRYFSLMTALALVAGVLGALPAKAQATSEAKFFLASTGCPAADTNFDFLTVTDLDDEIECFYTAAGLRADIGEAVGNTPATSDRETATRRWDTVDGIPLVLDATRPVAGEIYTSGGQCAATVSGVPLCSPVGASVGQVILEIGLVGVTQGKEIEMGTQTDEFDSVPGNPHLTELSIQPDASLTGTTFETVELRTWIHGASVGHGVVKTTGEANSFITVPTLSGTKLKPAPKEPPGKLDPPGKGKKKGCLKGKGKKKGACPGKKRKKPKPAACPAYVPGEEGKDAPIALVTDKATEGAPLELEFDAPAGGANDLGVGAYDGTASLYQNIQVSSKSPETGLYVRYEFPDRHDYDLYLNYADGSTAASSGDFNTLADVETLGGGSPDGGWESGTNYESVIGIRTAVCGGYTARLVSYLTNGGATTLKIWLGEIKADPTAPGGGESALDTFWSLLSF